MVTIKNQPNMILTQPATGRVSAWDKSYFETTKIQQGA